MHKAIAILGEGMWQIDVDLGSYEDKEEAERIAETGSSGFVFIMKGEKASIMARVDGVVKFFDDNDVTITEVSKEKQKVINMLESRDPAYVVEAEDMVSSEKSLMSFVMEYGVGYKPDPIAYSVR